MSKGGGSDTTTVKNEIDPDVKAAYLTNLDYARDVSNALPVQQFAGYNPQYQAGEQQIQAAAQGGAGMQNLNTAADLTAAGAGYSPMAVGSNQAMTRSYYNPYEQDVINTGLADLERARQGAVQQMGERATAAKAFGGTRQGVAEALTNQQYGTQAGNMIANLRQQGFQNAQQMAQQAQLANQAAGLQGAQFRMNAAQQLGNLGQAQTAGQYQAGQALMGLGSARQQQAQAELDAKRNLNLQRLNIMQSALGLQPGNLGGTQTSTAPVYQNTGSSMMGGALAGYQMGGPVGAGIGALLGLL